MSSPAFQAESLDRARNGASFSNYPAIFEGFKAKGIAAEDIKPRENVFTFAGWRALGRTVKRGEHGVKICTFIQGQVTDERDGKVKSFRQMRAATVFHISQTAEIEPRPY